MSARETLSGNKSKERISEELYVRETLKKYLWSMMSVLGAGLFFSIILNLLLGYAIIWRFPVKQFLWTSDANAVCAATPLDEPSVSQARLKDLAATAAVQINTFDYANWRVLINAALDKFFTPHGRDEYRSVLSSTGIVQKVVDQYQVVSAVTMAPPNIAAEGKKGGRYFWEVEVPTTIYYQTNADSKRENRLLTFTIVRVEPSPINPNGVAIDAVTSTQLLTGQMNQLNVPRINR
ncbi:MULTISPECIES: DotI/IcmL family type IV secretion protein [Xanthobacter]|uniref:DotI/IcmL family type IV secretion protein n=2 Tax=Xanthobacter TaxID=279 RepID=A0A974PUV0_9HYPH|nr:MULTISPECIES: DotI/IcmL family type IV secretion protein [Xanthobacter]QRG10199.1 DotI/IcmL family type IV secretion protein [Xanthobacter dioxanivorans]UDQ88566.1 DotI/IcmL family type IV secretion protein [Xanthobacter autotrophicus]